MMVIIEMRWTDFIRKNLQTTKGKHENARNKKAKKKKVGILAVVGMLTRDENSIRNNYQY